MEKAIKVVVFNHNNKIEAENLYAHLSLGFKDVELWDSGSNKDQLAKYTTHSFGNIYVTGAWDYAVKNYKDWDAVWLVHSDVKMINTAQQIKAAIESAYPFGCWSPCLNGRAHDYMQAKHFKGQYSGLVSVKNIESQCMAFSGPLMNDIGEMIQGSKYGFGYDFWLCYRARLMGLKNYIDGRVMAYHPEGTGYSIEEANQEQFRIFSAKYGPNFYKDIFEFSPDFIGNLSQQ